MRQILDLLEWALLIAVLLVVVIFTPKLAAYVSSRYRDVPVTQAHPGDVDPDLDGDRGVSVFDVSFAPASAGHPR
ncbi:hypothetical protein [Aquisphaera insulae]|uniref:hypothetical protein n=1 Tax=Aquisphaera insulae TaxID=2712864 RepID=UPI0013EC6378|nr:hypothetical protein [Aquisphaera insulae]